MFDALIVTLWIEYNGQVYIKEADGMTSNCEATTNNLFHRFEKLPMKLVAVKCDTAKSYNDRKEYFNGKR